MADFTGSHLQITTKSKNVYKGVVLVVNSPKEILTLEVYEKDGRQIKQNIELRSKEIAEVKRLLSDAPDVNTSNIEEADVLIEEEDDDVEEALEPFHMPNPRKQPPVEEEEELEPFEELPNPRQRRKRAVALPAVVANPRPTAEDRPNRGKRLTRREQRNRYFEEQKLRDDDTFGLLDPAVMEEFDFEKNNALFDREKLTKEYNEYQTSNLPDVVMPNPATAVTVNFCGPRPTEPKYRCDENVLDAPNGYLTNQSTKYIALPESENFDGEYETDTGVQIPCVSVDFRAQLIANVVQAGFSEERMREVLGAGAVELCVTLLGGEGRLAATNHNTAPHLVVLCGNHEQGCLGLNVARQLATQGLQVTCVVLTRAPENTPADMELKLLLETEAFVTGSCGDLEPRTIVDMILDARLDNLGSPGSGNFLHKWLKQTTKWAADQKCPVVAIDPPGIENSPAELFLTKTRAVVVGAPLPFNYPSHQDKPYLVRVTVPASIYANLGLTYTYPFCGKLIIGLSRVR